jgi:hypothetical protein
MASVGSQENNKWNIGHGRNNYIQGNCSNNGIQSRFGSNVIMSPLMRRRPQVMVSSSSHLTTLSIHYVVIIEHWFKLASADRHTHTAPSFMKVHESF